MKTLEELAPQLSALFSPFDVKWRPQGRPRTYQQRTTVRVVAYIDARNVMDRLDAVAGPSNWSDDYTPIVLAKETGIKCTLTVCGVSKTGIGETSAGDDNSKVSSAKAGASDALKRAAVKFGIGRYLYGLGTFYVGYDEQRNRLTEYPRLPPWAIPEAEAKAYDALFAQGARTTPAAGYKAEETKSKHGEAPKAEKPKAEKPKAEKPKAEKPKAEKPKAEKPKAAQKPTQTPPQGRPELFVKTFGKHSGATLGTIYAKDPDHIGWIVHTMKPTNAFGTDLKNAAELVLSRIEDRRANMADRLSVLLSAFQAAWGKSKYPTLEAINADMAEAGKPAVELMTDDQLTAAIDWAVGHSANA
jgi:hypothetical protein